MASWFLFSGTSFKEEKNHTLNGDATDNAPEQPSHHATPVVKLPSNKTSEETKVTNDPAIVEDLFTHRNVICVPYRRLSSTR